MPISSRSYVNRYSPSSRFPLGVKWLLIVNIAIFLVYKMVPPLRPSLDLLALVPKEALGGLRIWQVFTYMFLHTGVMSVLWNMLSLWMFGAEIERTWGMQKFIRFYLLCGVIAGLTVVAATYAFGSPNIMVLSSAGAIYGILAAYAVVFPENTLLFGFLIPMKSKYFVLIIGAVVFLQTFPGSIGDTALLAGMLAGYLLLRGKKLKTQIRQPIVGGYKDWKLRRARKKFEVYLRKRDSGSDRWVN
jgi:membrane associated rhomboid family serine protease